MNWLHSMIVTAIMCASVAVYAQSPAPPAQAAPTVASLFVYDQVCLAPKILACAKTAVTTTTAVGTSSTSCPEGFSYRQLGPYNIPVDIFGITHHFSGNLCIRNEFGSLTALKTCEYTLKSDPAIAKECGRSLPVAELQNTIRNDMRILLNQLCKASSADISKCDTQLPSLTDGK